MRDLLRYPWWKRILAGDTTAVPVEWETDSGSLKLAGESAREFLKALEDNGVAPSGKLAEACAEFITRDAIEKTGEHPNGLSREEWEETYDGRKDRKSQM